MLVVYRRKPRLLSIYDGTHNDVALRFPYGIGEVNWWAYGDGTSNPAQVPGTTTTGIAVSVTNSLGTESILLIRQGPYLWSSPCLTMPASIEYTKIFLPHLLWASVEENVPVSATCLKSIRCLTLDGEETKVVTNYLRTSETPEVLSPTYRARITETIPVT